MFFCIQDTVEAESIMPRIQHPGAEPQPKSEQRATVRGRKNTQRARLNNKPWDGAAVNFWNFFPRFSWGYREGSRSPVYFSDYWDSSVVRGKGEKKWVFLFPWD